MTIKLETNLKSTHSSINVEEVSIPAVAIPLSLKDLEDFERDVDSKLLQEKKTEVLTSEVKVKEIKKFIENSKFSGLNDAEIRALLSEGFTLTQIKGAITEFSKDWSNHMKDGETIFYPYQCIRDILKSNHPFDGIPVIVGFDLESEIPIPKIVWKKEKDSDMVAVGTKGFYFANSKVSEEIKDKKLTLESKEKISQLLQICKKLIPLGDVNNGCGVRARYIGALLEDVYGISVGKIKINLSKKNSSASSNQVIFKLKHPFPAHATWDMHIVLTLKAEDGKEYAFDFALDDLLLKDEWRSHLEQSNPNIDEYATLVNFASSSDEIPEQPGTLDPLSSSIEELRKMYLFHIIDDSSLKRRPQASSHYYVSKNGELSVGGATFKPNENDEKISVVIGYNSETKELKFRLFPKIGEYILDSENGLTFLNGSIQKKVKNMLK